MHEEKSNSLERGYRAIADYALIGDTQTAALVASDGSIDWCCCPTFDSPAVFCRLLDARVGGWCRVGPVAAFSARREYLGHTTVLMTHFETSGGEWRLTDFMPLAQKQESSVGSSHRILRLVEGVRGTCECIVEFRPTFDFARAPTRFEINEHGAYACSDAQSMSMRSPIALQVGEREMASARWQLRAGERLWFVLEHRENSTAPADWSSSDCEMALQQTIEYWERWSARCTYEGPYHPLVRRSALTLKLLTFAPTGAIIAAPTTSLPEQIGGVRNWDYRYSWLRDAALTLYSLQSIGYHEEADAYFEWLEQLCLRCRDQPQIMYSIADGPELEEVTLDHLEGYRGSRPVRIGNAAFHQKQLDIYGEVLDAAYLHVRTSRHTLDQQTWEVLRRFANIAAARWREPDQGIWEVRGGPKHFLYSKLLCWVAVDRAIKLSETSSLATSDVSHWRSTRDEIAQAILSEGYNAQAGAFTQAFGSAALDASVLAIPRVGFLPATDPRVISTFERIAEQLTRHGLVYRYRTTESNDGLPGDEGTFALCSFWLVDNLAAAGRINEARQLFERVTSYANDVALFAEEVEPTTGELLGNFPQGFTHLALIQAAMSIARAESYGPERRPATPADRVPEAKTAGETGRASRNQ